jgi:L-lactate dehydrogenase complex protein LldF
MAKKLTHASLAASFNKDEDRVNWHDRTLWWVRQKRDFVVQKINNWEQLRDAASAIKDHVLENLHHYLISFESEALKNGVHIHWAVDAKEHNEIVLNILKNHSISNVVKSKSMLTEECHLNDFLLQHNIEVIDTDLGERIVQLAKEPPSHIVLPAIHKKKEEIGELFHQHLRTTKGDNDPAYLTEAARNHLREKFLTAKAAITGVNFAVAETGEIVVCTNEGNADMGAHLADVHIACMGIEKIIPERKHLGIFLRVLARSATGQPITTYSSHFRKPRKGQEMHIVIVDNGRTKQLKQHAFRNALKCIRCGACFNTCPVYRRSGGHSYQTAIAGPIGAILAPNIDMKLHGDLPFASTLCGSCTHVCPVKINIHQQLYDWRQVISKQHTSVTKQGAMHIMRWIFQNPLVYRLSGYFGRTILRYFPWIVKNQWNPWFKQREMPEPPKQSFHEWYLKNVRHDK